MYIGLITFLRSLIGDTEIAAGQLWIFTIEVIRKSPSFFERRVRSFDIDTFCEGHTLKPRNVGAIHFDGIQNIILLEYNGSVMRLVQALVRNGA